MIKSLIVKYFPGLGKYKRFCIALRDSALGARPSYSQHKEDAFMLQYLSDFDLSNSVFVDVGANHPTSISNTYLFYRKGLKGIVIEPNPELAALFRLFRKRDVVFEIGCSNACGMASFHVSKTPVLSSFNSRPDTDITRTIEVPILRLDDALKNRQFTFIHLLSIDVEGLNKEVLSGAIETVKRSLLVCIEFDSTEDKRFYTDVLGADFSLIQEFGCNMIFENRKLRNSLPRTA